MKIFSFLVLLLLMVVGCEHTSTYRPSEKERLADEVIAKSARQLRRELGLIPCGSGGGTMDQVRMLALSFDYHQDIDIEKGRELLVTAVEKFTANVNANERIRPYLRNYPFDPKNIEIRIFIHKPDGSRAEFGKLCVISALDGILRYEIEPDLYSLQTIHQETYEEAVQKLALASVSRDQMILPTSYH